MRGLIRSTVPLPSVKVLSLSEICPVAYLYTSKSPHSSNLKLTKPTGIRSKRESIAVNKGKVTVEFVSKLQSR